MHQQDPEEMKKKSKSSEDVFCTASAFWTKKTGAQNTIIGNGVVATQRLASRDGHDTIGGKKCRTKERECRKQKDMYVIL
jgi:hypothetical protein